eukprot:3798210-Pyramimonas_sp.AAC.1
MQCPCWPTACCPTPKDPTLRLQKRLVRQEADALGRALWVEAITRACAAAKVNRARHAQTRAVWGGHFRVGDVDYHGPTTTVEDHGVLNGPCKATWNVSNLRLHRERPCGSAVP